MLKNDRTMTQHHWRRE